MSQWATDVVISRPVKTIAGRAIVFSDGTIRELVPTREWHWGFSWSNWRLGACFQDSLWEFDFLCLYVWCDRYYKHGRVLYDPDGF